MYQMYWSISKGETQVLRSRQVSMQSAKVALFWDIKSKLSSWSSEGSRRLSSWEAVSYYPWLGSEFLRFWSHWNWMKLVEKVISPEITLAQRTFSKTFRDSARPEVHFLFQWNEYWNWHTVPGPPGQLSHWVPKSKLFELQPLLVTDLWAPRDLKKIFGYHLSRAETCCLLMAWLSQHLLHSSEHASCTSTPLKGSDSLQDTTSERKFSSSKLQRLRCRKTSATVAWDPKGRMEFGPGFGTKVEKPTAAERSKLRACKVQTIHKLQSNFRFTCRNWNDLPNFN